MEFNHLIVFCWFLMILSYVSTEPKDNEEPCFQQRVLHISLLKGRVFLSVVTACGHGPTFLETQWINKPKEYRTFQENSGDLISQAFPNPSRHQIINDPCYPIRCSLIQQARWSQVDEKNGPRLWLLDLGKRFSLMTPTKYTCPSKLIVFYIGEGQRREEKKIILDLPQKSHHILDIQLKFESTGVYNTKGVGGHNSQKCYYNSVIYFVFSVEPQLVAYDICTTKWYKISLSSRKYMDIGLELSVRPRNIIFNWNAEMLVTDTDGLLYIERQQQNMIKTSRTKRIQLKVLGTLLGPTDQLLLISNHTLFYVIEKFGVVVRCELKLQLPDRNITTEDNEIQLLTAENIQQIFSGPNNTVWLLPDYWLHTTY